jgi:membrane protein DedA with SNARE-associated domain
MSAKPFFDATLVQDLIANYGYAAVFVVVMLESSGIPVPGETVLVCASIYAGSRHGLSIGVIISVAACGAILGDNVGFWVGRGFGRALLLKHGHRVGINERELILGEYLFQRYGGSIVFFGRFVAFLRVYAALLAGANRLHPLQFTKYNASGGLVWATTFGIGGYALGQNMQLFARPLGWLALAATAIGAYLLWSFYKTHEEKLLVEAEQARATRENGPLEKLGARRSISEWKHNQQ